MPSDKRSIWAELIRDGGASTFFDTYSNDAELAQAVNTTFPNSVPVTAEQVRRDRQRFYGRPQRGEVVEEQEASPSKQVIRNKAAQLVVQEALVEILDNIFDNFERNKPDKLEVQILVYPETQAAPGEIAITENSGGVEKKRIVPLVQLGFSERSARGIGAWGEGFKMAVFALGEEVEVFSTYPGQEPVAIHFPRGWLDPGNSSLWKKWKVNTHRVAKNPPQEGTTVIIIRHLHSQVLESFGLGKGQNGNRAEDVCKELASYFGEVYAEKYHNLVTQGYGISIKIAIRSASQEVRFAAPVKARLTRHLAFIPWLRPIHWTVEWQVDVEEPDEENRLRTARLRMEVYAGLTATFDDFQSYSPHPPGVEMWGNGRLFSLKGRISDQSVGWGYKFGGGGGTNVTATASTRRIVIVALFTADDSRDIPWAAPVKNDYNKRSEFYAEIQETLAKVIRLFKDAAALHKGRLFSFAYAWTQFTDQQKLDTLFDDSDAAPEFKQRFANSRFGKKLLAFEPDFSFHEMVGKDAEYTVLRVHGISTTSIKNSVKASTATRESAEQVVEYLRAFFPNIARQAEMEEEIGLTFQEEVEL
ncbi:MAG: hypothetical protein WBW48_13790 [Anaerolineae bacterium]